MYCKLQDYITNEMQISETNYVLYMLLVKLKISYTQRPMEYQSRQVIEKTGAKRY
jgi:hypothetical protein